MFDLDTGKEIKPRHLEVKTVKDVSQGVTFQRAEIKILKNIPIFVPKSIETALIGLRSKFPNVEFSLFGSVSWNAKKEMLEVSEEFVIPAQQVSAAHIDYLEDPGIKYDLVIHKHPDGCRSFSGTDWKFINANCRHSILWCNGEFVEATTTIFFEPYDSNIRLPATIITEKTIGSIPKGAEDKIQVMSAPDHFHIDGIGGPYNRHHPYGHRYGAVASYSERGCIPDFDGHSSHQWNDSAMIEAMLEKQLDPTQDVEEMCEFIDDETDLHDRCCRSKIDEIMEDLGYE